MNTHCLRLAPGQDLKRELERITTEMQWSAAFILTGIGSLTTASIRFADADRIETVEGPLEILSLGGTLSLDGSHIHILVADSVGASQGGHLKEGAMIRTTAEIVIGVLSEWQFSRKLDPETGCQELTVEHLAKPGSSG
ncbi:MAG: PPC domain-containing DNA-binding protein [Verrucomicrobiota bacterium]